MILLVIISTAIFSCSYEVGMKVVVIEKTAQTKLGAMIGAFPTYKAVTVSGDTVIVTVPEKFRLNNKLPYKATMSKNEAQKIGRIISVDQTK